MFLAVVLGYHRAIKKQSQGVFKKKIIKYSNQRISAFHDFNELFKALTIMLPQRKIRFTLTSHEHDKILIFFKILLDLDSTIFT